MDSVLHVRAFKDNYIWLVPGEGRTAIVVDPGDAAPVFAALAKHALTPAAIFCTHHHGDHSDGIVDLCAAFPVPVYGPATEDIDGVTHPVRGGDVVAIPGFDARFTVIDIPGHTRGHIAFYGGGLLFCGDTLFSGGCGRLFEGTAAQMHASLTTLAALPPKTQVYCGHEYTCANLRFAAAVEPNNAELVYYAQWAAAQVAQDRPTLPSTIARERAVNPFLRTDVETVRDAVASELDRKSDIDEAVFARLRRWKDTFTG